MKKICRLMVIFCVACSVLYVGACKSRKNNISQKSYTVKLTSYNVKDLSYLDAKKIALETIGLSSYNPYIICIECLRGKYVFMFYTIDLDKIYRVEVNRQNQKGKIIDIKDNTYDFLRTCDYMINAEKALFMSARHAHIQIPTGYTYYSFLAEFNDGKVFKVSFGNSKKEYSYMVDANDPGALLGCDVYER